MVILYIFLLFFGFIFPIIFSFFAVYSIFVDFKGAPFVGTDKNLVLEILKGANLKKGQIFLELGSGDGRLVLSAVKNYGVNGVGVDLHLPLITFSRIKSKMLGLKNIQFRLEDFFKTDISKADVIFLFLMPKTLVSLKEKLKKESKKGVLIISHGFEIKGWERYLVKTQKRKLFPTYYYSPSLRGTK